MQNMIGIKLINKEKVHTQFNRQFDVIVILHCTVDGLVKRKIKEISNPLHLVNKPEDADVTSAEIREIIRLSDSRDFCNDLGPSFPKINFDAIPTTDDKNRGCLIIPINGQGSVVKIHQLIHSFMVACEAMTQNNFHQACELYQTAATLAAEHQEKVSLAAALVGEGQALLGVNKIKAAARVLTTAMEMDR